LSPEKGLAWTEPGIPLAKQEQRLQMLSEIDAAFLVRHPEPKARAMMQFYDEAMRLMRSKDLDCFDLSKESQKVRNAYGKHSFGQGCLLARRLVESGVRFVEVTLNGWDMHHEIHPQMTELGGVFDGVFANLIEDLGARGLLKSTLVVVGTEFGRTPEIDEKGGRGHYPSAYSIALAGAGVKQGFVLGKTDARGAEVDEALVTVPALHATIGHLLGLPIERQVTAPNGRPFRMGDGTQPVREILA
jgi:uncharacterized protein (DUF1501 family)